MQHRFIAIALIVSFTMGRCSAQVNYYDARRYQAQRQWQEPPQMTSLRQQAAGGNADAMYRLGRYFEAGYGSPDRQPNMTAAVGWYNRAVAAGNLNAIYRLGWLMSANRVYGRDAQGRAVLNPEQGRSMMQYSVNKGYQPQTDSVRQAQESTTQSTSSASRSNDSGDAAGMALLGLLGLAVIAAAAGGSSSGSSSGSSTSDPYADLAERTAQMNRELERQRQDSEERDREAQRQQQEQDRQRQLMDERCGFGKIC